MADNRENKRSRRYNKRYKEIEVLIGKPSYLWKENLNGVRIKR